MRRAMVKLVGATVVALAFTGTARADETSTKGASAKQPITIEVVITQRVPRPQAAVDIQKVAPSRPLAELRQPLLDRIEKAAAGAPF